jgi:hypothetical protein
MRELSFDQYEFASPGSEQSLCLVIAGKRQCPDLRSFAMAGCGYPEPFLSEFLARVKWRPLAGYSRLGQIEEHLIEFALVELPDPAACRLFVLSDEGHELDVLLEFPDRFVLYNWGTTA